MPFIQGSKLDKYYRGSLAHRVSLVDEAVAEHFEGKKVEVVAVHDKTAVAVIEDSPVKIVHYSMDGDKVSVTKDVVCKDVPVIDDENMSAFVAEELRDIAKKIAMGEDVPRTQVRELASVVEPGGEYWLTDIMDKMDEASSNAEWHNMYEANQEKIRTSLHGRIREMEGRTPRTKYSKISPSKLHAFEDEMRESLGMISSVMQGIVDECSSIVFHQNEDDFFGVTCESLKVEAQVLVDLLSKADKLMRSEDIDRISVAHDKLAGRSRQMSVTAAYLQKRGTGEPRS